MNLKAFLIVCVSSAMVAFPQNMIGCGPETNPYDYYTSFFHNNLPDAKAYKPFYYIGYSFLYEEKEPVSVADALSEDWAAYSSSSVKDARQFVMKFAWKDLNNLYLNVEKNQPLKIPDSVKKNGMTNYFLQKKDLECLGYIMYSKQVEPYVKGAGDTWDAPVRDSVKMAKLIKNGQQLYSVAKLDLFKLKYAYQVLRLAHYSGRYSDVVKWYDDYDLSSNGSSSLMLQLCSTLKAGALFHIGKSKEAALMFSQLFVKADVQRVSNYLGFNWSYTYGEDRKEYLKLCKDDADKAAMLALFALQSSGNELATMKEIFSLQPSSAALEVLAVREINKLEEKYFTPTVQRQPGGFSSYNYYDGDKTDSISDAWQKEGKLMAGFFNTVAQNKQVDNPGLYEVSAAHTAYIVKDFATAKKYLTAANKMSLTQKAKDQAMLTNLLVTISEKSTIDAKFEDEILPSVQWLQKKAKDEVKEVVNYWDVKQWSAFYRNLMTEILAKRYHAQNEVQKEVLCIGAADLMNNLYENNSVDFMRQQLSSTDVEKMFTLMESKQQTKFEAFLISNNKIRKKDVIDFTGTAYLRDYNYDKAIEWFNKSVDKKDLSINKNPFIDLLYDQEERLPVEAKFSTTKLLFAQEMKKLQQAATSDKANAAKNYYKYALGLYNMTYYGHTWELVDYYRSGSDGYYIPKDATAFKREYYGAFSAMEYFKKAMEVSTDKNFKARCLFMMAKCSQKQIRQPRYEDYSGDGMYDKMEADNKLYWPKFTNNQYFPELVKTYGSTPFYKEAFNSCSYLRDFVKKK